MTVFEADILDSGSFPLASGDLDRLLAAVARGEHGAFELVYEQLRAPIQRQVFAVLRDEAQSEEVTQEVLLELWRTAVRYHADKGSAAAWAMTIARRRAIDRVRHTAASVARDQRAAVPEASPHQGGKAATEAGYHERLLSSLDQLSALQREAITLAFYDGHTYSEVASILATPLGTVKSRIRDALTKLRGGILSDELINDRYGWSSEKLRTPSVTPSSRKPACRSTPADGALSALVRAMIRLTSGADQARPQMATADSPTRPRPRYCSTTL